MKTMKIIKDEKEVKTVDINNSIFCEFDKGKADKLDVRFGVLNFKKFT